MKIPRQAKRVFTGVLFNVHHWPQRMYDGSMATFEMIEGAPSVNVIATKGGKIAVLMQEQPMRALFPSLPGGRIDPGEKPLAAAKRELLEETGHEAETFTLMGEHFGSSKLYFHDYSFVARNCKKVSDLQLDGGEKINVTFVGFEKFLQFARDEAFAIPTALRFKMFEALLDKKKKQAFKKEIFGTL